MDETQLEELRERAPAMAALHASGRDAIAASADTETLEQVRVSVLGRKSPLTEMLRSISTLPADERPVVGRFGNVVRKDLEALLDEREEALAGEALQASLAGERVDVTLPGVPFPLGHEHLITRTIEEVEDIFLGLGYTVADGPEIETEYYNFTALNTPADHPARSSHDTFFIDPATVAAAGDGGAADGSAAEASSFGLLLRTQTSPVQVRVMEAHEPPVYIICPGKVYRRDLDATHTPMFHQVEGLVIDEGITIADLKGTLHHFTREFFGADREVRLRPHFFPFTEPSVEVDVSCFCCAACGGCRCSARAPAGSRSSAPAWSTPTSSVRRRRLRPRARAGLRLRHRRRAHRDAQARRARPARSSTTTTFASWSSSDESPAQLAA